MTDLARTRSDQGQGGGSEPGASTQPLQASAEDGSRSRRRRALVAALALATVTAGAGWWAGAQAQPAAPGEPAATPDATATATVERRDLAQRTRSDGTLGYGARNPLTVRLSGTVTWLPEVGEVVEAGQILARVDGRAILLLAGAVPAWRDLTTGIDDGEDVRQLEEALVAMGYAEARDDLPDDHFDWRTREAVRDLEEALGWKRTGRLDLGTVVFLDEAVRVASHETPVGGVVGGGEPLLTVTSPRRHVSLDVRASDRGKFTTGGDVTVELPDGALVDGRVVQVGRVADPGQDGGSPTVAVTVELADQSAAADLDEAPAVVEVRTVVAADALVVPVHALLALAEGGYAVERPDGQLVGVQVGAFADGWVEVAGDLDPGDQVVVPR